MPTPKNQKASIRKYWLRVLKDSESYWVHDGERRRPYVFLTGGSISNCYVNCTKIVSTPWYLERAARELLTLLKLEGCDSMPDAFCGSAYGAITLALEITRQARAREAWYAIKSGDGMEIDRFSFSKDVRTIGLCEDVITHFRTTRLVVRAIEKMTQETEHKGTILPYVLCIANRSGYSEIDGYKIVSLVDIRNAKTWTRGHNPFTSDGFEQVTAVYPKKNWKLLTKVYR